MSERAAFISAIIDTPTDDTPRLVFADWLDENGEPERAEFIRCQIEAANLPAKGRAKSPPAKRAAAILKKHEQPWREAVGLVNWGGQYVRGFLGGLRFNSAEFASRTAAILNREPVTDIRLDLFNSIDEAETPATPKWVTALAANPHLRTVTRLNSQSGGFAKHFPRLLQSPHFIHLHHISMFEDVIGSKGVKAIVNSPSPFVLTDLDLNSALNWDDADEDTPDAVAAVKLLATAPRFSSLKHLGLPFNSLGDKSIKLLLASKTLPQKMRLGLADNMYDEEQYDELLAKRFKLEDY